MSRTDRSVVLRNSLANFAGQLAYPLLSILLVPLYVRYLGLEGYGLVGFFSIVLALLGILTKGVGTALQKEVATRRSGAAESIPTLVRTYEVTYWGVGAAAGLLLAFLAPFIATYWLETDELPQRVVTISLVIIALRTALTLPLSVYQATLYGSERQVTTNAINGTVVFITAAVSALVVIATRSVIAFYAIELMSAFIGTLLQRNAAYDTIRAPEARGVFDRRELAATWKLSAGMLWSHGAGLLLTQTDRLLISRLLPLSTLGIFSAASAGGRLLGYLSSPFLNAVFPSTCRAAKRSVADFAADLRRNGRVVALLVLPAATCLAPFAHEVLLLWTRSEALASRGAAVLFAYVIANVLLAFSSVLYQGQLALDAPRFAVYFNTAALLWLPPLGYFLIERWGIAGGAVAWAIFCAASWLWTSVTTYLVLMKSPGELARYGASIWTFLAAAVVVGYASRKAADLNFPNQPAGSLFVGLAGSVVVFLSIYLISFGFRPPREVLRGSERGPADQMETP